MPSLKRTEAALRAHALELPETREDFPWGHSAFKVKGKVFLFMAAEGRELSLSVKLPQSRDAALMFSFAEPTGYGLGKAGWVSAAFGASDDVPLPMLVAWIDESYRAVAPKKLAARLDGGAEKSPPRKPSKKRTTRKPSRVSSRT